jgi:hypothetical protein
MRRILGFTALALAGAALSGTAVGLPGGEPDPLTLVGAPNAVQVVRCIGYDQVRLGLHNTTADAQYGDLFLRPTGPLHASRLQFSSYTPTTADQTVPVKITVPPDAAPGTYELGYDIGARAQAATPVTVVANPAERCVPSPRMTATETGHQGSDEAAKAIDGDPATIWRSAANNLPQAITVDLGGTWDLNGLYYRPRFDGVRNGNITAYTIATSADGKTFTDVASGTWAAAETMKKATFTAPGARYLRLTAPAAPNNVAAVAELVPVGVPIDMPDVSATAVSVTTDLFAGKTVNVAVSAGNWTDAPSEVEATVDVPAGWKAEPVRQVIAPGVVTTINVPVTTPAIAFPEPGVQPEVKLTAHAVPVGGGRAEGAPSVNVWLKPDAPVFTYARDFGTATSPQIIGGRGQLSPGDAWGDGLDAGWVGTPPSARDRGAGSDALRRDYVYSTRAATLRLRLPAGKQSVALLRGDVTAATGPMTVTGDGRTLVSGAALKTREFAWERFTFDGGRTVDLTISGDGTSEWKLAALVLRPGPVQEQGGAGGTVPPTLALTVGAPATFGAFLPGADRMYDTSTTATVTSTAGDATLTASGPVHLRNGAFTLAEPVDVSVSKATWDGPASNDPVAVTFRQHIGAAEPLRTGSYAGTVTLTLATTSP